MKFYRIHVGLETDQPTLMQKIKELGGSCIQTSEGLFAGADSNLSQELKEVTATEINPEDPNLELTPDMKKLVEDLRPKS